MVRIMAKKTKTSAKSRAGRKPQKRAKASSSDGNVESPLPPRKRAMALKKLKKLTVRSSKPSDSLGPHLNLSFDAPIERPKRSVARKTKVSKRKR